MNKTERGAEDLTDQQFGWLTARRQIDKPEHISPNNRGAWWLCECRCGGTHITSAYNLKRGNVKSCGCMTHENKVKAGKIRAEHVKGKTVGQYKTPGGSNDIGLNLGSMVVECRCPTCKRCFDRLSPDWVYQRVLHGKKYYFCSYSCWRADLTKRKPKRAYSAAVR